MKNTKTIHCYLIDDDPEDIDIFRIALEELEISVSCTAFTNCHEAVLSMIRAEHKPDCIFLDLYMGPASGKECLNMIINTEIISQIPTVILSGSNNEPESAELKKIGAHALIKKAHTIQELKDQLRGYFTTHFHTHRTGLS